ncbi:MaoC/PaaZ C-terminal domain-containing protein [Streptomyces fuscigenes]|uniref:MaoC/PaaZ C-terminal domain-containing protein n=1 Tax=Streptomyces fuscigenes TaxID=1528880 RepID=UPI001F369942|nr:MaoC/PaaZ C-terminal domain-containing protein [Streptomyces fuscigenes]MCF3961145.1 MaoC family dehydratase N-terminal domain-containing protein [Streptomyces fuscigenes]
MNPSVSWSDLTTGRRFVTRARTVTESDVVQFAGSTGDFSPMHVDHEFAGRSDFGGPIAHGLLGLSYAHGLMFGGGLLGHNAIAFMGMSDWRFTAPIMLGDTIHVEFTVEHTRERRNDPGQGLVTFDVAVVNQDGVVVQRGKKTLLMHTTTITTEAGRTEG